ncbi:hypothetical protein A9Q99_27105 [Gammaproteobacteria bacterium 45_16_T64]|nr:hypothetical protein A9Q99_27105 [Gammaproteobacteria bacterium 45_16_T64]
MKDPMSLLENLDRDSNKKPLPPVDTWHPEVCGDSEIRILSNGTWLHQGQPFKRKKLVELFARIIRLDADDKYYLVTPVEKMELHVDDVPFVAEGFQVVIDKNEQHIVFETNVGDKVVADKAHPVTVVMDGDEPQPYVVVRKNLKAKIARSVFYQLVDLATEVKVGGLNVLSINSAGVSFELGRY